MRETGEVLGVRGTAFRWPCKAKRRHAEKAGEQQHIKAIFEQMDRRDC